MAVAFVDVASAGASSATTTAICNKPTATVQGNYMVAVISFAAADLNMTTIPAPFTLVASQIAGSALSHFVYAGFAGASEPSSYSFIRSTTGSWSIIIASYSGVNVTTPIDASANDNEASANDATIFNPALVTTNAADMQIGAEGHNAGSTGGVTYTFPAGVGWNIRATSLPTGAAQRNCVLADRLLSALNPASFDVTASLAGVHNAVPLALLPVAGPPPDPGPGALQLHVVRTNVAAS